MEEKDRYIVLSGRQIKDTTNNSQDFLRIETVCKMLNQQDKENQQLKQQIEEYKTYKDWQDMLCCKSAQEVIDFVMSNYLTEDEKCRTIADLKQQLHDLPKKIVEEVEKCFTEYLPLKDKTGAGFYVRLNAILKKYGGENE